MSEQPSPVSVEILDKEYLVSCTEEEKPSLLESARLLNERMRQVRDSGKVFGTERMAVITALNVIHEFTQVHRASERDLETLSSDLQRLTEKVRAASSRRDPDLQVD